MARALRPETHRIQPALKPARSPVRLSLHGENLFLEGRFHRWQATTTVGHDLDELSVHMAVDVTSPDQLTLVEAEQDLLSFRSEELRSIQANVHLARGKLVTPVGERPFEMLVEVPGGHTAFMVLSFVIRKDELGDGWKELLTAELDRGGIDAERRLDPRMGVRDPELAAA